MNSRKLGIRRPPALKAQLLERVGYLIGFKGRGFLELIPKPRSSRFERWYCRHKSLLRVPETDEPHLTALSVNEHVVEVLDKFAELITFALGLVAALAWNEAIQQLFTQLLGEAGGALAAKFVYAVIVTLIVIFATISVSRAAERAKQREAERGRAGEFGGARE
jgi:hypothetical protein